jgi:hypothetical protein
LNTAGAAGIPWVSYAANSLRNTAVRGTPQGEALAEFLTARNHFAEEVTKFYAGSTGSEAERERAIANLDAAKSIQELRAAINQESKLMAGKVNALQSRWQTALGGPPGWERALRKTAPDFPIIQEHSREALDRIETRRNNAGAAAAPAASAERPHISSRAEFDALPPGASYIDARDGKAYRKP